MSGYRFLVLAALVLIPSAIAAGRSLAAASPRPAKTAQDCNEELAQNRDAIRSAGESPAEFFHTCWWHTKAGAPTPIRWSAAEPQAGAPLRASATSHTTRDAYARSRADRRRIEADPQERRGNAAGYRRRQREDREPVRPDDYLVEREAPTIVATPAAQSVAMPGLPILAPANAIVDPVMRTIASDLNGVSAILQANGLPAFEVVPVMPTR